MQVHPEVLWLHGPRRCMLVRLGMRFELQLFLQGRLTIREGFGTEREARQKAKEWAAILIPILPSDPN